MTNVFKVADILISHVRQTHGKNIALAAYYGSHAIGKATPTSDLDLYYVLDDGRTGSTIITFVLDGLPYDFGAKPWRVLENIANAKPGYDWVVSASQVADAKILYSRSPADLARFEVLRERIAELTRPEGREFMVTRALDEFQAVLSRLSLMRLALACNDLPGLHLAGWQFTNSVANCLALVNQTYFAKSWGAIIPCLLKLGQKPADLETLLNGILLPQSPAQEMEHADRLAVELRKVLLEAQASLAEPCEPKKVFRNFYFDVHEYKAKVLSACRRGDAFTAGAAAFALQKYLCELMNKVERGFYGEDFNLLGEYSASYLAAGFPDLTAAASQGDLPALSREVERLDEKAREWFPAHEVELNILADEAALHRLLEQRQATKE
jgi:predicted nucleotidyltransferase